MLVIFPTSLAPFSVDGSDLRLVISLSCHFGDPAWGPVQDEVLLSRQGIPSQQRSVAQDDDF